MARIFLSYSRADRQFVDEFVPLLRRVYGNDSVWFDDDIHGGSNWWKLILSEIGKCDLFVYLISNDSLESQYCRSEFREALRQQKPFLPVIIRPKTDYPGRAPGDLQSLLRRTQYVDMSRGFKDHTAISQLYAATRQLLEQSPPQPQAPLDPNPIPEPNIKAQFQRKRFGSTAPWAIVLAAVITGIFAFGIIAASTILGEHSAGDKSSTKERFGAQTTMVNIITETDEISSTTQTSAPFITQESPTFLATQGNETKLKINSELEVAWQNTSIADPKEWMLENVEILEQDEQSIQLMAEGNPNETSAMDWRISSKRVALENAAHFVRHSDLFDDPILAQYYFIRGVIENVDYDELTQSISLILRINLLGE